MTIALLTCEAVQALALLGLVYLCAKHLAMVQKRGSAPPTTQPPAVAETRAATAGEPERSPAPPEAAELESLRASLLRAEKRNTALLERLKAGDVSLRLELLSRELDKLAEPGADGMVQPASLYADRLRRERAALALKARLENQA